MGSSVDVGVVVRVVVGKPIDDSLWLLCCGAIVEPYEWMSIHLLVEHGEVAPNLVDGEGVGFLVVDVPQLVCFG